jgi:RimJ/RimL family protein N-acetyltransferase
VKAEITTDRLSLRPCRVSDADALHALWTDPDVRRYLWDDQVISRELADDVVRGSAGDWAEHGFGQWVICPRGGDEIVGFCGFRREAPDHPPELLYGLAPAYWGRGLATEAARAVLRYGFEELGFERVWAATDPPNAASVRVMERLGMRFDRRGTLDGLDTLFYALTRDELRERPLDKA